MSNESDALYTVDTSTGEELCSGPSFDLDIRKSTATCMYWLCRTCGAEVRQYAALSYPTLAHYTPAPQVATTPLAEAGIRRIVSEELAKVRASLVHDVLYELSQRMKAQRTNKQ